MAPWGPPVATLDAASRADLRLAVLPLLFAGTYAVGAWAFGARSLAVLAASLACAAVVADGLFWHRPDG